MNENDGSSGERPTRTGASSDKPQEPGPTTRVAAAFETNPTNLPAF